MNNIRKKYQQKNQAISEMVGRVDKELDLGEGIQKMGDKTDAFKKVIKSLQEEFKFTVDNISSEIKKFLN